MRMLASLVLLLGTLGVSGENYKIDPSHTRISFEVNHMGYSTMPGIFRNFDVQLGFDPAQPLASILKVVIHANSVDTFYQPLNEHLMSKDFFNVEKFPVITYTSQKVNMLDEAHATVQGELTLLGVTQPLSFDVVLNQLKPNPMNNRMRVGFSGEGVLDRTAYGMVYAAPLVGAEVHFRLSAEADRIDD